MSVWWQVYATERRFLPMHDDRSRSEEGVQYGTQRTAMPSTLFPFSFFPPRADVGLRRLELPPALLAVLQEPDKRRHARPRPHQHQGPFRRPCAAALSCVHASIPVREGKQQQAKASLLPFLPHLTRETRTHAPGRTNSLAGFKKMGTDTPAALVPCWRKGAATVDSSQVVQSPWRRTRWLVGEEGMERA